MTSGRDAKLCLHPDVDIQHRQRYSIARTRLYFLFTEQQYGLVGTVAYVLATASALHETCLATHMYTLARTHTRMQAHIHKQCGL